MWYLWVREYDPEYGCDAKIWLGPEDLFWNAFLEGVDDDPASWGPEPQG